MSIFILSVIFGINPNKLAKIKSNLEKRQKYEIAI